MNYEHCVKTVKRTGKPHIIKEKGRYYAVRVVAIFGSRWGFIPTEQQLELDILARSYCRELNSKRR